MPDARQGGGPATAARVADRLHGAAIHLLRRLRVEDTSSGLSGPRLSTLSVIVFGGPITVGDLAAAEQVKPPTMSRLVSALEARGLVTREGDASDARLVRVRATPRGLKILQEGRGRRIARLQHRLQELDEPDLEVMARATAVLERVVREL